jgi:peptidoglycan/LPS O-acetylase OafA/YrhL
MQTSHEKKLDGMLPTGSLPRPRNLTGQAMDNKPLDTKFLDGLRGLAALYVLASHASYLLQQGVLLRNNGKFVRRLSEAPVLEGSVVDQASSWFMYLFSFGLAPVMFFFVLSGFVIHLRTAKELHTKGDAATFDWKQFVWRRLRRLYPPLILALVVTWVLDALAIYSGYLPHTRQTPYPFINDLFAHNDGRMGLAALVGNLTFLQHLVVPQWGTNLPLWSLAYEWWFYMVYPLLWPVFRRSPWGATAVVWGIAVWAAVPGAMPIDAVRMVALKLPIWWFGVMMAEVYVGRIRIGYGKLVPLLLLAPTWFLHRVPEEIRWVMAGMAFCGIIALCFWLQQRRVSLTALTKIKWLGDMSYTMYVTHMPIIFFLSGMAMARGAGHRLPDSPWLMIAGSLTAVSFAYAAHFWVESPAALPKRERASCAAQEVRLKVAA